mgnify:CR=1 FL=1
MSTSSQCSSSSGGGQRARVVVALDFGTTFSGFAYARTAEPDTVYKFYEWPCVDKVGAKPYCKTQTSLYYEPIIKHEPQCVGPTHVEPPAFQLKSWGWSALVDYTESACLASAALGSACDDNPNGTSTTAIASRLKGLSVVDSEGWRPWEANMHNPRGNGFFATKFKLYLADQYPADRNHIPAGLSVENIIADYLRCISEFVLSELQLRYGKHFGMDDVQWCLTVPAIWDEKAKQTMKACAEKAGMVEGPESDVSVPASPFPLEIILEPEAASVYCQEKAKASLKLRKGDKLLIADVGGGTIDLVLHEKADDDPESLKVHEVVGSYGELGGGTFVDSHFFSFLSEKIGCFKEFCNSHPDIAMRIYGWWQDIKTGFDGEGYNADLPLPRKLSEAWEEYDTDSGSGKLNKEDYDEVRLEDTDFMKIFRPEVEKVLRLIEKQVRGVRVLMVVGGFAASPYLRKSIREKFRGIVDEIIVPEDPGSAICHGAVRLHIANDLIQSRIAKKTYGISTTRSPVSGDPEKFLFVDDDGVWTCSNSFCIFVRKGSRICLGHSVENSVSPSMHWQRSIDIVLYSSTKPNPKFTEGEGGVVKEGSFTVDISEGAMEMDKKRKILVTMCFGASLIGVRASRVNFGRSRDVEHGLSVVFQAC